MFVSSVALRKRFGNVPKAETKSVHLRVCQLTSVHDETAGEVWDKVIQQTTGNNNLSSSPLLVELRDWYGIFKVKLMQKASAQEFRKRWAAQGPLLRTQTGRQPDCGELKWHLLAQSNKGAISQNVFSIHVEKEFTQWCYLMLRDQFYLQL